MSEFTASQLEGVAADLERRAVELRARARAFRAHGPGGGNYVEGALLDMAADVVERDFSLIGSEIPARLRTLAADSRGEPTHTRSTP